MNEAELNLVKVPFHADGLVRVAKLRGLPLRELDDGYLTHAILRELWQENAPAPFLLRGSGRVLDAWGYTGATAKELREHAREFGDPTLLDVLAGGVEQLASKPMPRFLPDKRLGFHVRLCPVVRLSSGRGGKKGREVDAFLARCWAAGDGESVSRENVYREWVADRLNVDRAGVRLERVSIDSFLRGRFVRRGRPGSDGKRDAKRIERPDLHVSGEFVVVDTDRFAATLRSGVGRHRAFGFGMLLLVAPGSVWAGPGERGRRDY